MPKGKRKAKKIGIVEKFLNKCGYVRAPKKRVGKVAVKPYNRKAPVKTADQNPPREVVTESSNAMPQSSEAPAGRETI